MAGTFLSASVMTRSVCEDLAQRLEDRGWRVIRTSTQTGRLARLLDMVTTAWRRRSDYECAQVDVYSGPAFFWAESICWVLRRARKPYVLTLHGGNLPSFARHWPRRVERLLSSARVVTCPSTYLREQMKAWRSDIRLLPNPLDIASYPCRERRQPQPHLVWLRAFHAIYNPGLAARITAGLVAEFPKVHLTMIGPDKKDGSLERFKQEVKQLGLESRVTLPGGIPKTTVGQWLDRGDVFLNTTQVDNTPVSVIEAMGCGLPVVSTNVGGLSYLLRDEEDALLTPSNSAAAMIQAVRRVLTEPGLAERLGRAARQKAETFDWSVILPQWEALLLEIQPSYTTKATPLLCPS